MRTRGVFRASLAGLVLALAATAGADDTYAVRFEPNGADPAPATTNGQTIVSGRETALDLNRYQRLGWTFKGWDVQASATRAVYADGAFVTDLVASNETTVLYAKWEKNSAVSLFEVADENATPFSVSSLKGTKCALFRGRVDAAHTNQIFQITLKQDATCRVSLDPLAGQRLGATLTLEDPTTPAAADLTVSDLDAVSSDFALKAGRTYELTVAYPADAVRSGATYAYAVGLNRADAAVGFDLRDGAIDPNTRDRGTNFTFTAGTPYGYVPSMQAKDETHAFLGWYTNELGGARITADDLVRAGTLVARWVTDPFEYRIAFDANGGTGTAPDTLVVSSDATFRLPTNTFTRADYVFLGWSPNATATAAAYGEDEEVASALTTERATNLVFYAVWSMQKEAEEFTDANGVVWKYVATEGTATLSNWDEEAAESAAVISTLRAGDLRVPETVTTDEGSNLVVTALGDNAFAHCARLTSVTIPASVTKLGAGTFRDCTALQRVLFESDHALESVPESCFSGCASLESIDLPYSITEIGERAFADCTSLAPAITIPEHVETMGACVFTNCPNLTLARFLGEPPEDVDDEVYAGAAANFRNGVPKVRAGDGWSASGTWGGRTNLVWNSAAYSFVRVRFDANGGTGSVTNWQVKGHALLEVPDDAEPVEISEGNYSLTPVFLGWYTAKEGGTPVSPDTVITRATTFYAQWEADWSAAAVKEADTESMFEFDAYPIDTTRASVYNGFLRSTSDDLGEEPGTLLGTIQVTVAKGVVKKGVTNSTVTAVVTRGSVRRTYVGVMKNGLDVEVLPQKAGETTSYVLHFDAFAMTGRDSSVDSDDELATVEIQGSRNAMGETSDYAFDMKAEFAAHYAGTWVAASPVLDESLDESSGTLRLVLAIGAGGAVKVSGTAPDGTAFTAAAQLVMGASFAEIPLVLELKNSALLQATVRIEPGEEGEDPVFTFEDTPVYTTADGTVCSFGDLAGGSPSDTIEVVFDPEERLQMVGVAYDVPAALADDLSYPVRFSASKLPSGLKIDAASGRVSGVPTKAGESTATIRATSTVRAKTSGSAEAAFAVEALPDWAQGSFTGWMTAGETNVPGTVTLTVSKVGKVSGKIVLPDATWTFTANSYSATNACDVLRIEATAKSGKTTRAVAVEVSESEVAGTFGTGDAAYALTFVRQTDWKTQMDPLDEEARLIDSYTGYYTATLTPGADYEGDGVGYLTLTVARTGALKYVGKLPDGTSLSGSTTLAYADDAVFAVLFAAPKAYQGGSVLLRPAFEGASSEEDRRVASAEEDGLWSSAAPTATATYGAGFACGLELEGGWYSKTGSLEDYYGSSLAFLADILTLDAKQKVTDWSETTGKRTTTTGWIEDGVSAADLACWETLSISLNARGTGFVVDQAKSKPVKQADGTYLYEGDNDASLTFGFTQATGIFRGTFLNWFDYTSEIDETKGTSKAAHTSKKLSYEGVAVQGGVSSGFVGFSLWTRTGLTDEGTAFTYTESHKVAFE